MADVTIPVADIRNPNTGSGDITPASLTSSDTGWITLVDDPTVLLISNASGSARTITIYAGEGVEGVRGDLTLTVSNTKSAAVRLGSSRVKILTGTNKGKVKVTSDGTVTAYAVRV